VSGHIDAAKHAKFVAVYKKGFATTTIAERFGVNSKQVTRVLSVLV
jgi:transcription initiation factor IIE alpha subunit